MALNKDTVSINLAKGVDTKNDDKITSTNQLSVLENAIYNKDFQISKRNGVTTQSATVQTDFSDPPPIESTNGKSKTFAHENQLMMENNGMLYSRDESAEQWICKGNMKQIQVETKKFADTHFTDSGTTNGITVLVYGGDFTIANVNGSLSTIHYRITVVDDETGSIIASNTVDASTFASTGMPNYIRVLTFPEAGKIWVLYGAGTTDSNHLLAVEVNLNTGGLGSPITLATDTSIGAQAGNGFFPEFAYTSGSSAIGEANFVVYSRNLATTGAKIIAMLPDGTLSALGSQLISGFSASASFGMKVAVLIDPSIDPNRIFISQITTFASISANSTVIAASYTFTSSAYTQAFAAVTAISNVANINYFIQTAYLAYHPSDNTKVVIMATLMNYENALQTSAAYVKGEDSSIYWSLVDYAGTVTEQNTCLGRGYQFAAYPIRDTVRKTLYLPVLFLTPGQSTLGLIDFFQGKPDGGMGNIAKWDYRTVQAMHVPDDGAFGYLFVPGFMNLQVNTGILSDHPSLLPNNLNGLFPARCTEISDGIFRFTNYGKTYDINLNYANAPSSQYYAKTTHLSGGQLWAYDGETVAEHNFLYAPEDITYANQTVAAGGIQLTVNQVGDGTHTEQFTISMVSANAMGSNNDTFGFVNSSWFKFTSTGGTAYVVYWSIDGNAPTVGVLPAGTKIEVIIPNRAYSAQQMAAATIAAITAFGSVGSAVTQVAGLNTMGDEFPGFNGIKFISNAVGAVTAPTINTAAFQAGTANGSYQYVAVWKWTDRNGQIYRSAPSVPISLDIITGNGVSLYVYAPPITNKDISSVEIEIYRTLANGTTFHQMPYSFVYIAFGATTTTQYQRIYWDPDSVRVTFYDIVSDATLASQPILYTDGGILENSTTLVANTSVSFFKSRLQVAGITDDPYQVVYSKTNVVGEPINFTEFTNYRVDNDVDPITAVQQLDGNSIIFKKSRIYIVSGDGANDLGQGSTFQPAQLMASNVGTSNPNSIVLYDKGLMFKSDKGIWIYDRANSVSYIGVPMDEWNEFDVSAAVQVENTTEIRFILSDNNYALVYNYLFNRWDYFTNYTADSACIWQNKFTYVRNNGEVAVESTNYYDLDVNGTQVPYQMYCELPWLKLKGIQNYQRIYSLFFLGDYKSPHQLVIRVYVNYDETVYEEYTYDSTAMFASNPDQLIPATPEQIEVYPQQQRSEAMKISIREIPGSGSQQSVILNDCTAYVGLKKGPYKLPPKQRI